MKPKPFPKPQQVPKPISVLRNETHLRPSGLPVLFTVYAKFTDPADSDRLVAEFVQETDWIEELGKYNVTLRGVDPQLTLRGELRRAD